MTSPAPVAPVGPSSPAGATRTPNRLRFGDRYRGVRWRPDTGFEMRCDECPSGARYWPLTPEFWDVHHGLSRCAACWRSYWRRRQAAERARDPEYARARSRAKYRKHRKTIAIKRHVHYLENKDKILARRRAAYAAKKAA